MIDNEHYLEDLKVDDFLKFKESEGRNNAAVTKNVVWLHRYSTVCILHSYADICRVLP